MKVKGTGSRCLLEECVKDNYYARFQPHSYHCCKEMKFIPRLDANCGRTDGRTDERTNGRKVEPLYRTLLKAGAIIRDYNRRLVSNRFATGLRLIGDLSTTGHHRHSYMFAIR